MTGMRGGNELELAKIILGQAKTLQKNADELVTVLAGNAPPGLPQLWRTPVGNDEHPPEDWYVYTWHDPTGRRNSHIDNYPHIGIDFNGDWRNPETGEFRGNVDIGEPVFAVADGEVVDVGWSETWRGGIVLKVDHYGVPLYVRYWHLDAGTARWKVGQQVCAGWHIGDIDVYPTGYAHLHFDIAAQPFKHNWWHTRHPGIEWLNPVWILKAHIDPDVVDSMTSRG